MAIRVLATFPELSNDLPVAIPGDSPTARSASTCAPRASCGLPVAVPPADAGSSDLGPAVSPAPRRPRQGRPRKSFPAASVAALALVAAAIWSLIAIREARPPEAGAVRLAAEVAKINAAESAIR